MSEQYPGQGLSLVDYQGFVGSSRYSSAMIDQWREASAGYITGELFEFLHQHGPSSLLLSPKEFGFHYQNAPDELRFAMADELGDKLWFGFDIAARLDKDAGALCEDALNTHTSEPTEAIMDFSDLQDRAIEHADTFSVSNKSRLLDVDVAEDVQRTSLEQNPHYVLLRVTNRLRRSLAESKILAGPPTATELEPRAELEQALGDYLLVLAYISRERLGISIEDVARFNIAKLEHREAHGKENDIHFSEAFLSE